MTSGVQSGGTDLDSLLSLRTSAWPAASATSVEVAGTDLNSRYAPASAGTVHGSLSIQHSSSDVGPLFATLGTCSPVVSSSGSNVSGTAASSTVTSSSTGAVTVTKGSGSYTYSWTATVSTGSAVTINTSSSSSTTVTGNSIPAGPTTWTGTLFCTITDANPVAGQSSVNTSNITYSLTNSSSSFSPHTDTFNTATSSTIAIPSGATTLVVEIWGGANSGGHGAGTSLPNLASGGGGGSGGYSRSSVSVSGVGGQTISYTVGNSGSASSISNGTFSITTMTANAGTIGGNAPSGTVAGTPGSGGTASGGNVQNTTGNSGSGSTGGAAVTGVNGTGIAGGHGGLGNADTGHTIGGPGVVVFRWT